MTRYTTELLNVLRERFSSELEVEAFSFPPCLRRFSILGRQVPPVWQVRFSRWVEYPVRAKYLTSDVYHIQDQSHAHLAAFLPAGRTILTCHDIIPLLSHRGVIDVRVPKSPRWSYAILLRAFRHCAHIIAVSESTRQNLIDYAGVNPAKVSVVRHGVGKAFSPLDDSDESKKLIASTRASLGIPNEAFVILHVGTNSIYKNVSTALRAHKIILESHPLTWFLRVGAPLSEGERQLIAALGTRDRFVHAGYAPDDSALANYYRSADALVFPSLWEGFGWPPLEAMACGLPVVVSNRASLPEIVGSAGILLDPDDDVGFAHALSELQSRAEFRKGLRTQGLLQAERLSWTDAGKQTLAVYRLIIEDVS